MEWKSVSTPTCPRQRPLEKWHHESDAVDISSRKDIWDIWYGIDHGGTRRDARMEFQRHSRGETRSRVIERRSEVHTQVLCIYSEVRQKNIPKGWGPHPGLNSDGRNAGAVKECGCGVMSRGKAQWLGAINREPGLF